jgi:hypothetical protein
MKIFNLIVLAILLVANTSLSAKNYDAPVKQHSKQVYTDTLTNDTYTVKGKTYPVFKSKSDARYIWKENKDKTHKIKVYLPREIQKQMGRKYDN